MGNVNSNLISEIIYYGEEEEILAKGLTVLDAGRPLHDLFRCTKREIIGIILACMYLGIRVRSVFLGTAAHLSEAPLDEIEEIFLEGWGSEPGCRLWNASSSGGWVPLLARQPEWPFTPRSEGGASNATLAD